MLRHIRPLAFGWSYHRSSLFLATLEAAVQTCFVIMPFGTLYDKYYERVYSPAIMDAGLEPQRADEIFTPGPFMRDVVLGIMKSSMILAELTGRNANVFYELGLCHALEKTAVLIAQSEADIPSDLRALKFLTYNTADPDWANYLKSSVTNTLRSADNEESSSRFRLPGIDDRETTELARSLAGLSPTQKRVFDHIKSEPNGALHDALENAFMSTPRSELFYRLETLRLTGLIESKSHGLWPDGKPKSLWQLSTKAKKIIG